MLTPTQIVKRRDDKARAHHARRAARKLQNSRQPRQFRRVQNHVARRRENPDLLHDRHADLRLLQRARVVQAVADHHHLAPARLEFADEIQFVRRALVEFQNRAFAEKFLEPRRLALVVAAQQRQFKFAAKLRNELRDFRPQRIFQRKRAAKTSINRHANAAAARIELVGRASSRAATPHFSSHAREPSKILCPATSPSMPQPGVSLKPATGKIAGRERFCDANRIRMRRVPRQRTNPRISFASSRQILFLPSACSAA